MIIFISGLVLTGWIYQTLPQGFIPDEDQGYCFVIISTPPVHPSIKHLKLLNR